MTIPLTRLAQTALATLSRKGRGKFAPTCCQMARAGDLPAAAGLAWSTVASQDPPRSLRSFAQYSRRFLISRSKPRSGGS
jgi:hypothetical protein